MTYTWPGNVREMQNALERAINVAEGDKIMFDDLPLYLRESSMKPKIKELNSLAKELAATEKEVIIRTLKATQGNKVRSSEILGIHRTNLYRKMDKYGLTNLLFTEE
ncbi:helix-turn-helix domain-containing protein [Desulfosporosinus acidiphilus]|uniref:helix-turn-helix domain-containing protein n=1 Tax=Desulfosporosinus acidiphilus TaxID=885581 RepID=UPI000257ACA9|nr:helix-turn-helix domain-containing protein [Desulfosporosinus acidiphilus]